jgi:hypothetical protein
MAGMYWCQCGGVDQSAQKQGKKRDPHMAGRRLMVVGWPWPSDLRSATASCPPASNQRLGTGRRRPHFSHFFGFLFFWGVMRNFLAFWENG